MERLLSGCLIRLSHLIRRWASSCSHNWDAFSTSLHRLRAPPVFGPQWTGNSAALPFRLLCRTCAVPTEGLVAHSALCAIVVALLRRLDEAASVHGGQRAKQAPSRRIGQRTLSFAGSQKARNTHRCWRARRPQIGARKNCF